MLKKVSKKLSLAFTLLLFASITCSSGAAVIAETTTEPVTEESQLIKSPEESVPEAPPVLDVPETMNEDTETNETAESQETQEKSEETEMPVEVVEETQETIETTKQVEKSEKDVLRTAPQNTETGDFTVEGGKLTSDYTYEDHVLKFIKSGDFSVSGVTTEDRIVIDAVNVKLTLESVSIDVSGYDYQAALMIEENATATIDLIGENALSSGIGCAGLQNNNQAGNSLVIDSGEGGYQGYAGSLNVRGGNQSAGIGNVNSGIGTVTINGGSITSMAGDYGSGIGGGVNSVGQVIINGGSITSMAGIYGSGIGGGFRGNGTVIINGGTVTTTGGSDGGSGIGNGKNGSGGSVTINGGSVKAVDNSTTIDSINPRPNNNLELCTLIPSKNATKVFVDGVDYKVNGSHENDDKYYLYLTKAAHEITVETADGQQQEYAVRWDGNANTFVWDSDLEVDNNLGAAYVDNLLTLGGSDQTYTISMREGVTTTTADRIKVTGRNVTVRLNDVKIDVSNEYGRAALMIEQNASATIKLVGENELKSGDGCAGLQNDNNIPKSLVISSDTGPYQGYAGSLEAIGGNRGAGIGGRQFANGTVEILGGEITATGRFQASGIGGGSNSIGTITIEGGVITATGVADGAGIGGGGGRAPKSGTVTINGGTIAATGGSSGSDIGRGNLETGGEVFINGGNVKTKRGNTDSSIQPAPVNRAGKEVGFCDLIPVQSNGKVLVDGANHKVETPHESADKYYLYLTKENHTVTVTTNELQKVYSVIWDEQANKFILWESELMVDNFTDVSYSNNEVILAGDDETYNVSMSNPGTTTTKDRIKVTGSNVTVKLNNVKIDLSSRWEQAAMLINSGASATVDLVGENQLKSASQCAGLQNDNTSNSSLVINSEAGDYQGYAGRLEAQGGAAGAGIGGGNTKGSLIEIKGGLITATGGYFSAGIGGGNPDVSGSGIGEVIITGGAITANGSNHGSAIGGGYKSEGIVSISGGTITANGGDYAHGIGDGAENKDHEGEVTITGGSIKASAKKTPISPTPTSDGTTPLGLYQADASSYTDESTVKVGTTDWKVSGKHTDDDNFYLYLPEEKHVVTVANDESFIEWKEDKFVPASTYTLSIPKTVELKKEGNAEQVKLTNNFHGVPGYNKQVTANLTSKGMVDQNLILKNSGNDQKQAQTFITYEALTLPKSSKEEETDLTLGKPIGTEGNDPLQAGTYKGAMIFEAVLSDEGVRP